MDVLLINIVPIDPITQYFLTNTSRLKMCKQMQNIALSTFLHSNRNTDDESRIGL